MSSKDKSEASGRTLFQELIEGARRSENAILIRLAGAIAVLGIILRITLTFLAGNRPVAPFSGVGDQIRYQALADSIFRGNGFTYAGQPTALRPPLYPILLAASHVVFGSHFFLAMRIFQLFVGIAVAYVCLLVALKLFGLESAAICFALALVMPTLVLSSVELQTEHLTAFVTILFLYFLLRETRGERGASIGLGLTSGFAMLLRFNCAFLAIIGAAISLWFRRSLKDATVVCVLAGVLVSPWIVRNLAVFNGSVVYSSHGGINLLQGILSPEGRAQKGEGDDRVRAAVGWLHTDLELNSPHRLKFGSEDVLDKQARTAAILAWKNIDWKTGIKLLGKKLGWFWLGLDQYLETSSFSPTQQRLRAAGVAGYWLVLVLACVGLLSLASVSRTAAASIVFYMSFVTVAHLPFVMNTRLRIPFIDPFLTALSAGGIAFSIQKASLTLQAYKSRRGSRKRESLPDRLAKCSASR